MNQLYFGDNLNVLRECLAPESVDLIYLDPPFNSQRDYNLLFKSPKGQQSEAQIQAFKDSWVWDTQAESEFDELMRQPNTAVAEMMSALLNFVGRNDMMAYLTMMANRLLEMRRVLKPDGSLWLHCDPTASHYLKELLDAVFGKENFRNEIIWKRATPKGHAFTRFPVAHDVLFYYTKEPAGGTWNPQFTGYDEHYLESHYNQVEEATGRRYRLDNLMNPNKKRPNLIYEFPPGSGLVRVWRWTRERMQKAWEEGRIIMPEKGKIPAYKRYLDEMKGTPVTDVWTDIPPINSQAQERLGYPTQKPVALLERIIRASSNEGDVVLDPFCGCGTAVHAAQKLGRKWIGVDITHLAISLIEKRLKDSFKSGLAFEVHGTPKDLESARDLARRDKYQFQWWAISLVDAQPSQGKRKGADGGVDGLKFFRDLDKADVRKIVVSVKGGEKLKADDVRSLMAVRESERAEIAVLISLAEPTPGMRTSAASAGYYESPNGRKFPRVQLLTIADLLDGKARAEHPDYEPNLNFKKAQTEATATQEELL